jgi:hypothetical protein
MIILFRKGFKYQPWPNILFAGDTIHPPSSPFPLCIPSLSPPVNTYPYLMISNSTHNYQTKETKNWDMKIRPKLQFQVDLIEL